MLIRPLVIAFSALALAACTPPDAQQHTSAALADGVLLPAYSAWAEADSQLASSAQAFCAGDQDLAAAQQTFLAAQSAWAGLQPLLLGPLAEGNRAWQVQFWPDKKNLVKRQVEALLKAKPQLTPADLEQASVVVQGLTAYEYLLFDAGIDLTEPAQKNRYCPLLVAIGEHQQNLAAEVLTLWQNEDGMLAKLKNFPNPRYAEAEEAVAELLRTQVSGLDGLKKKLGTPLGRRSKGHPQPYQADAWRSHASLANLAASLASAERLWLGAEQNGLRSLLNTQQAPLAEQIDAAYRDTRQRLAALQQPLGELLTEQTGREELDALYESLDRLHRLHEIELAKTLGIQMGFNSHDGD